MQKLYTITEPESETKFFFIRKKFTQSTENSLYLRFSSKQKPRRDGFPEIQIGDLKMAKENNAVANVDQSTGVVVFDPSKVKAKKILNVPVLSQKGKTTIYVTLLSKIFIGKEIAGDEKDGKKKGPAHIAYGLDLISGRPHQVIMSAMQNSVIEEAYPNHSYIDKSFMMINHGKINGKDYNTVEVVEIDTPDEITAQLPAIKSLLVIPA